MYVIYETFLTAHVFFVVQRKENEILMSLTLDIYMWLQYRKFQGLPDLRQEGDFIVATRNDRHQFESFRDLSFNSKNPLPSCPLLHKYIQVKRIPVTVIKEFDCEYVVGFPISEIDELCEWAQMEINSSLQDSKYKLRTYVATLIYSDHHDSTKCVSCSYM